MEEVTAEVTWSEEDNEVIATFNKDIKIVYKVYTEEFSKNNYRNVMLALRDITVKGYNDFKKDYKDALDYINKNALKNSLYKEALSLKFRVKIL